MGLFNFNLFYLKWCKNGKSIWNELNEPKFDIDKHENVWKCIWIFAECKILLSKLKNLIFTFIYKNRIEIKYCYGFIGNNRTYIFFIWISFIFINKAPNIKKKFNEAVKFSMDKKKNKAWCSKWDGWEEGDRNKIKQNRTIMLILDTISISFASVASSHKLVQYTFCVLYILCVL